MTADELKALIANGEGRNLEFKSSMRYDFQTNQTNKALSKVVPKTIAAFLNSDGGTLLIGVSDDSELIGVSCDVETLSKKTLDYYEIAIRTAIGRHLGVETSAAVDISFVNVGDKCVAAVSCAKGQAPVFFTDGDRLDFYIRDGNSSCGLHVKATHSYIAEHFKQDQAFRDIDVEKIADAVAGRLLAHPSPVVEREEATGHDDSISSTLKRLREHVGILTHSSGTLNSLLPDLAKVLERTRTSIPHTGMPPWFEVATSRVLDSFLKQLATSVGWKRIFIVSPWLSDLEDFVTIRFRAFLRRIQEDGTTVYVITRPPNTSWHQEAVDMFAATKRANIVFVENMHAKLYTAVTNTGRFALLGSANFTQRSLMAEEIGILVNAFAQGKQVLSRLDREAERIYRTPGRTLAHKAQLST